MHFQMMWQDAKQVEFEGHTVARDYNHMLQLLSDFVQSPPPWDRTTADLGSSGLPYSDLFYYAVLTPSGYAAFTDPEVSAQFKKLLQSWGQYLETPASAVGLQTWLNEENGCLDSLVHYANAPLGSRLSFEELFFCDARKQHYGFTSWDDFFVRRFRPGLRPLCTDPDAIVNACESAPLALVRNVQLQDEFWMKNASYSLVDIFDDRHLAEEFTGGTLYQAFLSQYSYHRWHAPISGTVTHAYRIDGSYFTVPRMVETFCPIETGHLEVERCQAQLSCLSSRAVIVIASEDPGIGSVAFIGVGLHEVSTTEISVRVGQRIQAGEELGMFHYGGSTHCLIFQPHVSIVDFPMDAKNNVPVNAALARIARR
jgi:phosphatidylserine decarboxylase